MKKRYGERLLKWETHKKTFNIHTSKQQLVCSVKVSVKIVFGYLCKQVTKIKTAVSHIITSRWSWLWISMGGRSPIQGYLELIFWDLESEANC